MLPPDMDSQNMIQVRQEISSHPWFEKLARFGYIAKGIVYIIIGLLALQTIGGTGGKTTGSSGALVTIASQPFGKIVLAIMTVGILGYVMWRAVQGIIDPEHSHQRTTWKNILRRIGYISSAIAYLGLAYTSLKLIVDASVQNNDNGEDLTLLVMSQPFGRWLVILGGIVIVAVSLYFLYFAYEAKFRKCLQLEHMSHQERNWVVRIGRFGIAARGLIFMIIGGFVIRAGIQLDPSETKGMGGVLSTLARQPFGAWLMGFVALGLAAYGTYSLLAARYRKIAKP